MSNSSPSLPYRACVGMAVFNEHGKVFVGERIDNPGAWQMPQGGVDPGEDITTAALREIAEEIGTSKVDVLKIMDERLKYDFPEHLAGKLWNGKYRGQEQTWIALRFLGNDSDINISSHIPMEFKAWKWVGFDEIMNLIVPFKRDIYVKVVDAFSEFAG